MYVNQIYIECSHSVFHVILVVRA